MFLTGDCPRDSPYLKLLDYTAIQRMQAIFIPLLNTRVTESDVFLMVPISSYWHLKFVYHVSIRLIDTNTQDSGSIDGTK